MFDDFTWNKSEDLGKGGDDEGVTGGGGLFVHVSLIIFRLIFLLIPIFQVKNKKFRYLCFFIVFLELFSRRAGLLPEFVGTRQPFKLQPVAPNTHL